MRYINLRLTYLLTYYWRSIVTMALSRINTEIKQDIGRKSRFLYPLRSTPPLNGSRRNIAITFGMEKRSVLPDGEMFDDTYSRIDAIGLPACDRQTDGRTAPLWPNLIAERLLRRVAKTACDQLVRCITDRQPDQFTGGSRQGFI